MESFVVRATFNENLFSSFGVHSVVQTELFHCMYRVERTHNKE